ncbi:MAG: Hsp20/alpha crystallin family protein [Armatimonadota bacterium]
MSPATTKVQELRGAPQGGADRVYMRLFSIRKPISMPARAAFEPPTDVYETDSEIVVRMEVAGADTKATRIDFLPQTQELRISGRRNDPVAGSKRDYHQLEVVYGPFGRSVHIPVPVDPNRSKATYRNGFLHVYLPKRPQQQPRAFSVEVE